MGNRQKRSLEPVIDNILLEKMSRAIVGGGCFWCVEAVLQRLRGVAKIESGYAGGLSKNPSYEAVCSGQSGHAEVVRVHFDPSIIDYRSIFSLI